MPHEALDDHLPGPDGKPELYKAAGKLKGKKALITGGEYAFHNDVYQDCDN